MDTTITMYGADWCSDCRRSKKLLDDMGVDYEYVDLVADPSAADRAKAISGRTSIPVIAFSDGTPITSDDFRYSWERMLNPRRIPSPGAENYRLIVGFDAFREGRAAHLIARFAPCLMRRFHHRGLAGSGHTFNQRNPVPAAHVAQGCGLFVRQAVFLGVVV